MTPLRLDNRQSQRNVLSDEPISKEELDEVLPLAQIANAGGDGISAAEWERLKKANLDAPPKRWSTSETDLQRQEAHFSKWAGSTPFLSVSVLQPLRDWIASDKSDFDKVITNEPTGRSTA